ncbi:MAG: esterase family protein, partial [Bacteroidales bacterium]|nr:esterase family protein [Bacteroidales bacterium]
MKNLSIIALCLISCLAFTASNLVAQEEIPQGIITKHSWDKSKLYPGTTRDYWVYVPAQYKASDPACVMVIQDGHAYIDQEGPVYVPALFDKLIHNGEMPVTIGIFINPGKTQGPPEEIQRRVEYATMNDTYARFLVEEIIPEVGKSYTLFDDASGRAICGSSAGGICSFTAAWERPDVFSKVISFIGGFAGVPGGGEYPALIRETKGNPKPIRVFLQSTENDLNWTMGDFRLGNMQMASALEFAKYDYRFELGPGGHDLEHAGSILPEILQWLWRDFPSVKGAENYAVTESEEQVVPVVP